MVRAQSLPCYSVPGAERVIKGHTQSLASGSLVSNWSSGFLISNLSGLFGFKMICRLIFSETIKLICVKYLVEEVRNISFAAELKTRVWSWTWAKFSYNSDPRIVSYVRNTIPHRIVHINCLDQLWLDPSDIFSAVTATCITLLLCLVTVYISSMVAWWHFLWE